MKRKLVFAGAALLAVLTIVIFVASQRVKREDYPTGYYEATATPDGKLTFQRGERSKMTLVWESPHSQTSRAPWRVNGPLPTNTAPATPPR
ncbi:MAG TPA: hypothetical protein VK846_09050 [Candidatus Limnocylindria bacterium]|nr:hypothetical protein [Candidatus Limnocylindria bacterium]